MAAVENQLAQTMKGLNAQYEDKVAELDQVKERMNELAYRHNSKVVLDSPNKVGHKQTNKNSIPKWPP